jgi:nucleoside-diphosphate-sugar epimerase
MKSKKIALIGGAGFIGHNLAISLKNRGHEPIIIDSLSVNNILSFTDIEIKNRKLYSSILNRRLDLIHDNDVEINIEDAREYNAMSLLLGRYKPDVIIQLAAVSHANKSNKDPHTTFDHTLRTLENTLDIARSLGSHVIYLSSSMVYGHFHGKSVTEDSQCNPLGIYDTLKYTGEQIVKAYNRVFDIPFTIIRPSALYGERCVSRRVSQIFIENAVQGLDISINGDGSDRLDFTYIEDFIQGVTLAVENEKSLNETFNITYGESRSIGEMAEILKDHFDDVNIHYTPKDSLTPDRGTLSVNKARDLLGYQPQNPIEIGYPKYIEWYKEFWDTLKY